MSSKNSTSKTASKLSKTIQAGKTFSVQLSDSAFAILNEAIAKNNHFQTEAQKAQKELQNNLLIAIEGAGLKTEDFAVMNLNNETKELILNKKIMFGFLKFSDLKGGIIPSGVTLFLNSIWNVTTEQGVIFCFALVTYICGILIKYISREVFEDKTAPITIWKSKVATWFKNLGR